MGFRRRKLALLLNRVGVTRALLKARAHALLPGKVLTVLTYHRVSDTVAPGFDPEVVDATPRVFEQQLLELQRYFTLVDTRDLDAWRGGGELPANPAMVTFDDGYRDNHDVVLPILQRRRAKAVFFIASQYIADRRVFWWEHVNRALTESRRPEVKLTYPAPLSFPLGSLVKQRLAIGNLLRRLKQEPAVDMARFLEELYAACGLPFGSAEERKLADALLMSWDQVRALHAAGMDVQSHSHAHRVLQTLPPEALAEDLTAARTSLEEALGKKVTALAYPTGKPIRGDAELRQAVRTAGFRYGFTVDRLVPLSRVEDWLDIPRIMMDRSFSMAYYRSTLAMPALAD